MRNLAPHACLIKPHEPHADIDRHVYAERCELEALQFLQSWCRARKRLAAQERRSDAEKATRDPSTPTLFVWSPDCV